MYYVFMCTLYLAHNRCWWGFGAFNYLVRHCFTEQAPLTMSTRSLDCESVASEISHLFCESVYTLCVFHVCPCTFAEGLCGRPFPHPRLVSMFRLYGSPTPEFIARACSVLPEPQLSQLQAHLQLPGYTGFGAGTGLCAALGWPDVAVLDDAELAAIDLLERMTKFFGADRISVEDALAHEVFTKLQCRDEASEVCSMYHRVPRLWTH